MNKHHRKPSRRLRRKRSAQARKIARRLYRRGTAARVLDCSITMLKRLEKAGKLTVVRLGGRDVFYPAHQVEALAEGDGER